MKEKILEIKNRAGLHARPAALFVQVAAKFQSSVWIEKGSKKVNGKSIMGIISLAIPQGSSIKIITNGSDENEAIKELEELITKKFTEQFN